MSATECFYDIVIDSVFIWVFFYTTIKICYEYEIILQVICWFTNWSKGGKSILLQYLK